MFKLICMSVLFSLLVGTSVRAELDLVGNRVESLIDGPDKPARLIEVIGAALQGVEFTVTATTQAWSGSGLLSGRYDGYIDHYNLNQPDSRYLYSDVYAEVHLHIASRMPIASTVNRFDQLTNERIGIEKRFANTDLLRSERTVKWARRDSFAENIDQLQEERVDFILADKIMLEEFNKLLASIDKPPLYISKAPLLTVGVQLAINSNVDNAQPTIEAFNAAIIELKSSGKFDQLYFPTPEALSILDDSHFSEALRKW